MAVMERLKTLGLELPIAAAPVSAYVPIVEAHGLLHVSGQLPFDADGRLITGRLAGPDDIDKGAEAAKRCALMVLAQLRTFLGDLDGVKQIVKLGVFVSSEPGFVDQPKVSNGASELMASVFGEFGLHARSAVGVSALPLGALVEVDAVVALKV